MYVNYVSIKYCKNITHCSTTTPVLYQCHQCVCARMWYFLFHLFWKHFPTLFHNVHICHFEMMMLTCLEIFSYSFTWFLKPLCKIGETGIIFSFGKQRNKTRNLFSICFQKILEVAVKGLIQSAEEVGVELRLTLGLLLIPLDHRFP